MKCIVTGGAGFIGSHLVDRLVNDGHEVQVWDSLISGDRYNVNSKAQLVECDITGNYEARKVLMSEFNPDVVFHLAAMPRVQPSIEDPIKYHNANVNGTLNMLNLCVECGVKKFVFSSSSSVYGDVEQKDLPTTEESKLNPMSPYALHKLIGEQYCKLYSHLYGLETVSLRYFNVYGERQPTEGAYCLVMGVFAGQLLEGKSMTVNGDGEQRRDFTFVGDVVDANVKCATAETKWNGDVFNIGAGNNYSVNDVANLLGGDRVHRDPVIEPRETLAENSKVSSVLGWKSTTTLEEWIPKWKKVIGLENNIHVENPIDKDRKRWAG